MKSVADLAREIVVREGGYVNDPDDPGGATNHGVTIHTARRLGLDLDHDGDVDARDIRTITPKLAEQIFLRDYFEKPKIDRLPQALQASVFDMYVNSGSNAVKILQRVIRAMGIDLIADGVIGPMTIKAANKAIGLAPAHLADAYGIGRRNYYYSLADKRRASRKYARRRDGGKGGWITRAEEFISPKYHLTLDQHKERVASWA